MADLVTLETVQAADPSLSPDEAQDVLDALLSQITREAPCLATAEAGVQAEARLIIRNGLRAVASAPDRFVDTDTVGPWTVRYRDITRGTVLLQDDMNALRALCGAAASGTPGGLPRGSFPEPAGVERLFQTSRGGWPWPR